MEKEYLGCTLIKGSLDEETVGEISCDVGTEPTNRVP